MAKKPVEDLAVDDDVPSYRRIAAILERRIIDGNLAPGSVLPTETRLVEEFGVNRSTIREGLRALESTGLVRRIDSKRMLVTVPDRNVTAWSTMRAIGLRQVRFQELWEALLYIEPLAAELAAHRRPSGFEVQLEQNIRKMRENLHDDEMIIRLDVEFHELIGEATSNRVLAMSHDPICRLIFSATKTLHQKVPQGRHRMLHAHQMIYDAVIMRDAEKAKAWMARHIRDLHRGYLVAGLDINAPVELTLDNHGETASGSFASDSFE